MKVREVKQEILNWISSFELHSSYQKNVLKLEWEKGKFVKHYSTYELCKQANQFYKILYETQVRLHSKIRTEFDTRIWFGSRDLQEKVSIIIIILFRIIIDREDVEWDKLYQLFKATKERIIKTEKEYRYTNNAD